MRLDQRLGLRLLAPLALLGAPAAPARANVTGNVDVQSQTTQNLSQAGAGTTQATLLMETLSLHYAGLPFGPGAAIATLGGAFSNVAGWGDGQQVRGRMYSFDGSLGLLPRRAVPLRLFGSGSFEDADAGALASRGPGLSLLYGGALNLEPGRWMPGLRLDASEGRTARPGHEPRSDVQRRLAASSFATVVGQRVNLSVQVDDEHRDAAGDTSNRAATLSVSSPLHQTTLLATETHRSLAVLATLPPTVVPALPPPSGITTDRMLSASSDQRWSPGFTTQVGGRLSDAGADAASGRAGDLRAGATWVPLRAVHQLTLTASGNAGFTETRAAAAGSGGAGPVPEPGAGASGTSWGAAARAAYGRLLGAVSAGVGLGASVSTFETTRCDGPATGTGGCAFGNDGTTRQVDATASLALAPGGRASGQVEYTVTTAFAPIGRGGDRLENHARTSARIAVGQSSSVSAGVTFDDGFRELIDITTGRAAGLHEQAVGGSLGASTQLGRTSLSSEVRHSRGTVVTNGTPFVAGGATQVRSLTSGYASSSWSPFSGLALQGQLLGSRADLTNAPGVTSAGANVALVWRLGRMTASLQYQGARVEIDGSPATLQQSIRASLSRPFELWR